VDPLGVPVGDHDRAMQVKDSLAILPYREPGLFGHPDLPPTH
jgi:hypothetical protein